jgi:hypothetical protein
LQKVPKGQTEEEEKHLERRRKPEM